MQKQSTWETNHDVSIMVANTQGNEIKSCSTSWLRLSYARSLSSTIISEDGRRSRLVMPTDTEQGKEPSFSLTALAQAKSSMYQTSQDDTPR